MSERDVNELPANEQRLARRRVGPSEYSDNIRYNVKWVKWLTLGKSVITIGQTIYTSLADVAYLTLLHEEAHREQWRKHGKKFALLYVLALWRGYRGNRFEVEARAEAVRRLRHEMYG